MTILTRNGGLAGDEEDRPEYLEEWQLEGSHFTIEPKTLLMHFIIFHSTDELQDVCKDSTPLLPAAWFDGKREGDILRLKYQEKSCEFTINHLDFQKNNRRQKKLILLKEFLKVQSSTVFALLTQAY